MEPPAAPAAPAAGPAPVPGPARDLVGYGRRPPKVVWPNGASVALSICVNYEEGSEPSHPDGDGRNAGFAEIPYPMDSAVRDLTAESGYEFGSRAGIWRIADVLDSIDLRATFLACAVAIERNPEVGHYIRERGHEACFHGWRWEEVFRLTREEEREHLLAGIASLERTCGHRPVGCYLRATPSAHTRDLLVEEGGFLYDSDDYSDELPFWVEAAGRPHLVVPYTLDANDARFATPNGFRTADDFATYLIDAFEALWREGATRPGIMNVGLHCRLVGRPGRIDGLRRFLDHVRGREGVWVARRADIARHWIERHPPA